MRNQENRPVAIQVSGVKKMYRLGQIGGGTLQADLQSWWARVRGKEDPNTKIGEDQRSNGQTFMALNGIDMTIYQGEAVGIIGSNGAGKSTLLKLLSKVTSPTEGEIDIYGRIASMLEVGTGFNGELTGRENVYMNGAILGMTKQEIDAKMEQIIEFSEVREFIDTPVKRYSSGMFVKLAFSVAAHLDSEIMIMDEVLAVGDLAFQKKCLDKMREAAKKNGRTVLYVSHNMNTIRQLCDRCIVLEKGRVVCTGDVESCISVYCGVEEKSLDTVFDEKQVRWKLKDSDGASFKYFSFVGKSIAEFNNNEKMRIKVKIDFERIDTNLQMGIQIYNEARETIGFGYCKMIDIQTGIHYYDFEFDLSILSEGAYCLRLILHVTDGMGDFLGEVDQTDFISFNITNHNTDMLWHKEWWNNVRINSFTLVGVDCFE